MWELPGGIVGRVGEYGTEDTACKEVAVSRWLKSSGVRAARVIENLVQPTVVDGYPITWWKLLPQSRPATPAELGATLRRLHDIPAPHDFEMPHFSPFGATGERLKRAEKFRPEDTAWVLNRMTELNRRCKELLPSVSSGVIHGDAWQGNFVVIDDQEPVIIDLEAFCVGPRIWDLIAIAVDYTDFARLSGGEYEEFVATYGFDVTTSPAYRTLADVQELRWTSYILGKAKPGSAEETEAAHRVACLKGEISRPWTWAPF